MKRKSYRALTVSLAVLGTLLIAVTVAVRMIDIDRYKGRIEAAVTENLGLRCTVGRMHLSLRPRFMVRADNVRLAAGEDTVMQADSLEVTAKILPVLTKEIHIASLGLEGLSGTIVREGDGRLNLLKHIPERAQKPGASALLPIKSLKVDSVTVKNSRILYTDVRARTEVRVDGLDLKAGKFTIIKNFTPPGRNKNELIDSLDFQGKIKADLARFNTFTAENIGLGFRYRNNVLEAQPLQAALYGGAMHSTLILDMHRKPGRASLTCSIRDIDTGLLLKALGQEPKITGRIDLRAQLESLAWQQKGLLKHLQGDISVRSNGLTVDGFDLDTIIKRYEKSQNIDLIDIGSFFIVGPFGPLLSKAYDISGTIMGFRGQSRITRLVSDWQLRNAVATTNDVAFATSKNRIALKGKVNLEEQRFDNLEIAVLNPRGCAEFSQTINGTFQKPEIRKTGLVARSVVNPVFSLLKKAKKILFSDDCPAFYQGSVPHPVPD